MKPIHAEFCHQLSPGALYRHKKGSVFLVLSCFEDGAFIGDVQVSNLHKNKWWVVPFWEDGKQFLACFDLFFVKGSPQFFIPSTSKEKTRVEELFDLFGWPNYA